MSLRVKPAALANLRGGNNLFQSAFWGRFKALYGWKPYGFSLDWNGAHGKLLALVRELGSGFKVVYVPHGPDMDIPGESYGLFLEQLSQELEGARAMTCSGSHPRTFHLIRCTGCIASSPDSEERSFIVWDAGTILWSVPCTTATGRQSSGAADIISEDREYVRVSPASSFASLNRRLLLSYTGHSESLDHAG